MARGTSFAGSFTSSQRAATIPYLTISIDQSGEIVYIPGQGVRRLQEPNEPRPCIGPAGVRCVKLTRQSRMVGGDILLTWVKANSAEFRVSAIASRVTMICQGHDMLRSAVY